LIKFIRPLLIVLGFLSLILMISSLFSWLVVDELTFSYDRIFSRSVLFLIATSLVPLWRIAGLDAHCVGLQRPSARSLLRWFVAAAIVALPVVLFFFVTGFRVRDTTVVFASSLFLLLLLKLFVSSWLVGFFEEVLFRGVMFAAAKSTLIAAISTSALYASVHFIESPDMMIVKVGAFTGFVYVWEAFSGLADIASDLGSFATLFLIGLMLCWVRTRYGLWACVAIHASWVFVIRTVKESTVRDIVNPFAGWVGSYDNFVGPMVFFWLVFIVVMIHLSVQHKSRQQGFPASTK